MDADELQKFCVGNAGEMAEGKDKDGKTHKGRILAYTPSKSGGWILLEDTKLPKSKGPKTLPSIPYFHEKWFRVVADCHLGIGCIASTIKLINKTIPVATPKKVVVQEVAPVPVANKVMRNCGHTECHVDWCWMRYAGFA